MQYEQELADREGRIQIMKINVADIVIPINGRDEGKHMLVVVTQDEYSLLADGKGRRVDKPKRKKNKHLEFADRADDPIAAKLTGGEKVTNNEIRRELARHCAANCDEGGM